MKTIIKNCLNCNKEFNAPAREVKRGNGKFCTQKCSGEYNGKNRPRPEANVKCAWCSQSFYRNSFRQKFSKSRLFFCTRKCKDEAQCIGGIKEIMPTHYGTGSPENTYRRKVFATRPKKCERCGFDNHEAAIIVHHKDRNRENDDDHNLEVLCCNCHAIEHWGADASQSPHPITQPHP
jgi:hypothetical protein